MGSSALHSDEDGSEHGNTVDTWTSTTTLLLHMSVDQSTPPDNTKLIINYTMPVASYWNQTMTPITL